MHALCSLPRLRLSRRISIPSRATQVPFGRPHHLSPERDHPYVAICYPNIVIVHLTLFIVASAAADAKI